MRQTICLAGNVPMADRTPAIAALGEIVVSKTFVHRHDSSSGTVWTSAGRRDA
jgi:hypothetical protein